MRNDIVKTVSFRRTLFVIVVLILFPSLGTRASMDSSVCDPGEQDSVVYHFAEVMPSFPGNLKMWVKENLLYPIEAFETGVTGRVFVSAIVEPDGSLANVCLMKSLYGPLDEEAVRIVQAMPKWNPGKINGQVVRVQCCIPVEFEIKNEKLRCTYEEYIHSLEQQNILLFGKNARKKDYLKLAGSPSENLRRLFKDDDREAYEQVRDQYILSIKKAEFEGKEVAKGLGVSKLKTRKLTRIFHDGMEETASAVINAGPRNFIKKYDRLQWKIDRIRLKQELETRHALGEEKFREYFDKYLAEKPVEDVKIETEHETCDKNCKPYFIQPSFNGNLFQWLQKNLRYPKEAQNKGVEGKVYVEFVVRKDGSVTDIRLAKPCSEDSLNEEALRVVKAMPRWIPGKCKKHNRVLNVSYTLPVNFAFN